MRYYHYVSFVQIGIMVSPFFEYILFDSFNAWLGIIATLMFVTLPITIFILPNLDREHKKKQEFN